MPRLRIIFLAAFALVCLSRMSYGAVRLITETQQYGFTPLNSSTPLSEDTSDDGSNSGDCGDNIDPCSDISYGCELSNTDATCEMASCCENGVLKSTKTCPEDFTHKIKTNIPNYNDIPKCWTQRGGSLTYLSNVNASTCAGQGLTDAVYVSKLTNSMDCGEYGTSYNCEEGTEKQYCVLDPSKALTACPADYQMSPDSQCSYEAGDGSEQTWNPMPCAVACGDGYQCLAYSCGNESLPTCESLIASHGAVDADGNKIVNKSDTYDENYAPYLCLNEADNTVQYIGFGVDINGEECSGTFDKTTDICQTNESGKREGAQAANTCAVNESDKRYRCGCNSEKEGTEDIYRTLWEYCTDESSDPQTCMNEYYGIGKECLFTEQSTQYMYTDFSSEIKTCDTLEQTGVVFELEDSSCSEKPIENFMANGESKNAPVESTQCREINTDTYQTQIKTKCLGCVGYKAENEAECPDSGKELMCPYGDADDKYVIGCTKPDESYKTVDEWCGAEYQGDDDEKNTCINTVQGDTGKDYYEAFLFTDAEGKKDIIATYYTAFACGEGFMTKEEFCNNPANIAEGYTCDDYVGLGQPCKYGSAVADGSADDESLWKYQSFGIKCPGANSSVTIKESLEACAVEGDAVSEPTADICYDKDETSGTYNDTNVRYICHCPRNYGISCEDDVYYIRSGTICEYDFSADKQSKLLKYEKCELRCGTVYTSQFAANTYDCAAIDNYESSVRGGIEEPEMCALTEGNARVENYICACPSNFRTLEDWCTENYEKEGLSSVAECTGNYVGRGTACSRDIVSDNGNIGAVLTKYAYFVRYCPTDRPLYYNEQDCSMIGGEYNYSCLDETGNERVVCQCPTWWYPADNITENACQKQTIGEHEFNAEAGGNYCDFDGTENLKYEECVATCSSMMDTLAVDNAYTYLSSDSSTPTQTMCTNELGNGAVLGYGGQAFCSLNHTKMYPCYCPASFRECLAENNEMPAENATLCRVNDTTYYSSCTPAACEDEGPNLAVVETSADVSGIFGPGAETKACTKDGKTMYQVSCDTSVYTDPCDYPYEAPDSGSWCKYNTSGAMEDGREYYMAGACKIKKELGACGSSVIEGDTTRTDYTIFVAETESECTAKYGPGISTQLCEYGADQGYKRAYNCYYDPSEFKYTTDGSNGTVACGVRHDLTGDYIIVNGQKRWRQCNCAGAYQHHKFNCGGLLSGNACQQEITTALAASDSSLGEAVDEGYLKIGATLPFYPYCECSADYTEVCDEDGSGRYQGVGEACNGKYKSCECVPDELPENWTDNYYGCPGGEKPTGVWKDNGCGKKYYQCSVIECTWEYTEMCEDPLIPVGQACQDSQGNVGGYKACTCPAEYQVCPTGQVGEGEPCNLKGVSYYKSCKTQDSRG